MNIYFSGIGGVGIGPLAEIARDAGYTVQGSDAKPSLITKELEVSGVRVSTDQTGVFLEECHTERSLDWFVHTAALPSNHPELERARSLGIRTAKRDELLNEIIRDKNLKLIAIAGTHGKTTTTGMMVWALQQLGVPVSYSVGSTLSFGPSGHYDATSEFFVYECDEFDRNFLAFHPHLTLITSVDYDHPDTYPTDAEYVGAFRQFLDQSDASIAWAHDAEYLEISKSAPSMWQLRPEDRLDISLAGEHNRRNATLVFKALERLGVGETMDRRHNVLASFPGTDRRFEKLANNLYSDYGHHPVEIAATLQLARELSDHVSLVYQPHQNTRQHEIRDQYTDCFELADKIYWLPTYQSRENLDLEILEPHQLTERVTNRESIQYADMDDALRQHIDDDRNAGMLVLCMGAGSIDDWARQQL